MESLDAGWMAWTVFLLREMQITTKRVNGDGFMKLRFLVVIILLAGLVGCSSFQTQIIKVDDQNAIATMKSAKQILKHWSMNSAFIRISLQSNLKEKMPASVSDAMDNLDKLALKDPATITEADAGATLAYIGRIISPTIAELIKQYAPDVMDQILRYLPAFISL